MGCAQSSGVVIAIRTELVDTQPENVKYKLKLAIKRDDPILFQDLMKTHEISLQQKIDDGFDTNWTFLHYAAAKNAVKVIEDFLKTYLSESQLSFDIVNARDIGGNTPIQTAFDYSCFEAFEALLIYCSKYEHKVNIRNEFIRNIPPQTNFMETLKAYKAGSIKSGREPGGRTDRTVDLGDYSKVVNRGQIDQAISKEMAQIKENEKFKDKEFWQKKSENQKESSDWISIEKILGKDYKVFHKGEFNPNTDPSSVNPQLNYLLCAFSEYPSCLRKIFYSLGRNEQGVFSSILYQSGQPSLITLDEYFPSNKGKENLMYQKPFKQECWPLLLEKGLAKLYGGYSKIAKLELPELLEATLGAPVKSFKVSDNQIDIFWMIIQDLIHANCLTYFGLKGEKNNYFFFVDIFSQNEKRILKLRSCQPNSKLNVASPETILNEEENALFNFETKEDGYYLIQLEKFVEQFEDIIVCYFNEDWNRTAMLVKNLKNKAETFELEVKVESKVFVSFFQKLEEGSVPSPLHFVLIQKDETTLQTIAEGDSNCKTGSRICYIKEEEHLTLEPGKYLIQVKPTVNSTKSNIHQGTLVVYSSQIVELVPVQNKSVLEDILISMGKSTSMKEPINSGCEFTSGWWSIYHWLYFENNSSQKWEAEIKFEGLVNLKLGKLHQHSKDTFKVIIEKGQKKVVYLEMKDSSKPTDFKIDMNHIFDP